MKNRVCTPACKFDGKKDFFGSRLVVNPLFSFYKDKLRLTKRVMRLESVSRRCSLKKMFEKVHKFTGKHLYHSLFFNTATLLKKRLWHRCFLVNFAKFLRTSFLLKTSGRVVLSVSSQINWIRLSQLSAYLFLNKLHRLDWFWCIIIESRRLFLCVCVCVCVFVLCHMRVLSNLQSPIAIT